MKKIRNIILVPFGIMIIGYLLLVLINFIPESWILNEAKESSDILMTQGTYPSGYIDGWFLDNWTDADCISITINKSSSNPFFNAINAFQLSGVNDPYTGSIEALRSSVNGEGVNVGDHSFLWHGFRIWLKVLLIKYNITEIRTLLFWVTILLVTFTCVLLTIIKKNILGFIPFLAAFSIFNFQMEAMGLLFFNDFCIMLISAILIMMLSLLNRNKIYEEIFAGIGAIVAFSSMLIIPIITLSFPLIIALSYTNKEEKQSKKLVKYTFSWTVGYGITMATKILLSVVFINSTEGLSQVRSYSGQTLTLGERLTRLYDVFMRVLHNSEIQRDLMLIISLLLIVYILLKKRENICKLKELWTLVIVALYPCVWCIVCAGHTGHGWTSWNFSISIFALLELLWSMCDFSINPLEK